MKKEIIFLSDLQIPYFKKSHQKMLINFINNQNQFDILLCSGDIVQRSRSQMYKKAEEFFRQIALPRIIVTPGNHDISFHKFFPRILYPYSYFNQFFPSSVDQHITIDNLAIATINTSRLFLPINGMISYKQLEHCEEFFKQNNEKIKILMTHHPLYKTRLKFLYFRKRINQFFKHISPDLVLAGHTHKPKIFTKKISKKSPEKSIFIQNGTVSERLRRAKNTFFTITCESDNKINIFEYQLGDKKIILFKRHCF